MEHIVTRYWLLSVEMLKAKLFYPKMKVFSYCCLPTSLNYWLPGYLQVFTKTRGYLPISKNLMLIYDFAPCKNINLSFVQKKSLRMSALLIFGSLLKPNLIIWQELLENQYVDNTSTTFSIKLFICLKFIYIWNLPCKHKSIYFY